MLVLNKEKEQELVTKYGFEKITRTDNSYYYKLENSLRFEGFNIQKKDIRGKLSIYSLSTKGMDIFYDLIKADVIIKI